MTKAWVAMFAVKIKMKRGDPFSLTHLESRLRIGTIENKFVIYERADTRPATIRRQSAWKTAYSILVRRSVDQRALLRSDIHPKLLRRGIGCGRPAEWSRCDVCTLARTGETFEAAGGLYLLNLPTSRYVLVFND